MTLSSAFLDAGTDRADRPGCLGGNADASEDLNGNENGSKTTGKIQRFTTVSLSDDIVHGDLS